MMRFFIALYVFCFLASATTILGQKCYFGSKTTESTRFGGNEKVTLVNEKGVAIIKGFVKDVNGSPLTDTIIEVFDNPDWIKNDNTSDTKKSQKRLIACKVNKTGGFKILGIPKGVYELRISKGNAWNTTHLFINLNPSLRKTEDILIYLSVGT